MTVPGESLILNQDTKLYCQR